MQDLKAKKIAVLRGGWNEESEVSMDSGQSVIDSLRKNGYSNIVDIIFDYNFITKITDANPDIVFIALHGKFGEDGRVQSILDFLNIPYTHSPYLPCAIAMNKELSLNIAKSINIDTPKGYVLSKSSLDNEHKVREIGFPMIIKPLDSGSSVGVEVIDEHDNFNIRDYHWQFGNKVIVEQFVSGQEIQVAVINNNAIGAIEIKPKNRFYDYESKYVAGMSEYIMPANLSNENYNKALIQAQIIHQSFGCNSLSRVDFIYCQDDNKFYFLEINTHPGFTENSLVPKIAKYCGISFIEIIEYLLNNAKCNF